MTEWAIAFGWNWLLVPVLTWFARGVWVAWTRPRLKYRLHHKVKSGYLLSVTRQELMPPWRALEETYLVPPSQRISFEGCVSREADGWVVPREIRNKGYSSEAWHQSGYELRLRACLAVALARDEETEELAKL